jgi:hypothetical protein
VKEGVVVARAMGNCHVYTHKNMPMNVASVKRVGCANNGGPGTTNIKNEEKRKFTID